MAADRKKLICAQFSSANCSQVSVNIQYVSNKTHGLQPFSFVMLIVKKNQMDQSKGSKFVSLKTKNVNLMVTLKEKSEEHRSL